MMKTNQEGKTGYEEVLEEMSRKDREIEKQVEAMEEEIEKKIKDSGKKIQINWGEGEVSYSTVVRM